VEELRRVDEDLVRAWPLEGLELAEKAVADVLRMCREVTIGGLDRSFFTGSGSALAAGVLFLTDDDLCNPLDAGLVTFTRGGGPINPLLVALPVALGGRLAVDVDVLRVSRVGGFTGNRLGDWLVLPDCDAVAGIWSIGAF
jgi:hypothetical protein